MLRPCRSKRSEMIFLLSHSIVSLPHLALLPATHLYRLTFTIEAGGIFRQKVFFIPCCKWLLPRPRLLFSRPLWCSWCLLITRCGCAFISAGCFSASFCGTGSEWQKRADGSSPARGLLAFFAIPCVHICNGRIAGT